MTTRAEAEDSFAERYRSGRNGGASKALCLGDQARGFESHPLRHRPSRCPVACRCGVRPRRDDRVAEGARLESVCTGNRTEGSNPSLSANRRSRRRDFAGPEPCALCHRESRQARKGATVSGPTQVPQVHLGPISPDRPAVGRGRMYQVLARKWRPQTLDELVGQPHVARTLRNAVGGRARRPRLRLRRGSRHREDLRRTDPREVPQLRERPDGHAVRRSASSCREIIEGRSLDVMELDAASRTGVDNIRELQEVVSYAPVRDRYKVLIIDEAHMLSKAAFNALLKTLEEPPRARRLHPGHDRDSEAAAHHSVALPGLRVPPRSRQEHRRSPAPRGGLREVSRYRTARWSGSHEPARARFGTPCRFSSGCLAFCGVRSRRRRRPAGPGCRANGGPGRIRPRHRRSRRGRAPRVARCARGRRARPRALLGRARRGRARSHAACARGPTAAMRCRGAPMKSPRWPTPAARSRLEDWTRVFQILAGLEYRIEVVEPTSIPLRRRAHPDGRAWVRCGRSKTSSRRSGRHPAAPARTSQGEA